MEEITGVPQLPPRDPHGHKGIFGTTAVIGGCGPVSHNNKEINISVVDQRLMIGAPCLTAEAALRAGTGLSILMMSAALLPVALQITPCATGVSLPTETTGDFSVPDVVRLIDEIIPSLSCLAVGPGLGNPRPSTSAIVLRCIGQQEIPVVIDADGLNCLAQLPDVTLGFRANVVITPHPGEYRRLATSLAIEADPVKQSSRPEAAAQLARRLGCVVVLKGPGTIISDGNKFSVNKTGNAALAVGGSGDVLTGLISGFASQFANVLGLFECARLAAYVHGLVADRWALRYGTAGMLATDLLHGIPCVLAELRGEINSSQ